jgi:transcriptional antiterminator NusG
MSDTLKDQLEAMLKASESDSSEEAGADSEEAATFDVDDAVSEVEDAPEAAPEASPRDSAVVYESPDPEVEVSPFAVLAAALEPKPEVAAEDAAEASAEGGAVAVADVEAPVETADEAPTETATPEAAEQELEAEVEAGEEAEVEAGEEEGAEEDASAVPTPASPYDLPGSWFVVHSYSGYENKVKANLESRIKSMHMEDQIFDVVIPMEDVVEFKGGRKVTVPRKIFPGYILTRLYMSDDAWFVVRNTPGVTGFVGSGTKPTPLSRREVERILGVTKEEEAKKAPRFKPEWEVGETVRVVEGPFADFNGMIEDINVDQSKVRVLVDIFGRETPVELNFEQIQKY